MANKSAIPLLLGAGVLAAALSGKKKKKSSSTAPSDKAPEEAIAPSKRYLDAVTAQGGGQTIVFDQECREIAEKANAADHNNWLTNRYLQLVKSGIDDLDTVTLQLLKDQSAHCPWDDQGSWTELMSALYQQLRAAVQEFHDRY